MPLLDVHAHYVPERCLLDGSYGFSVESHGHAGMLMRGGMPLGPADETIEQLSDLPRRLRDMDAAGVDMQAISIDPGLFFYDMRVEDARNRADTLNESLAQVSRAHPDRFVALGTVCLQEVRLAVAQLEHCVTKLGFAGISICTNVNGRDLSESEFLPLFEAAESLNATLFLHPYNIVGADRSRCFAARVVIGNPFETTIALYNLVLSGLFERFPRLRAVFAHGGGALPFLSGRVERAFSVRSELVDSLVSPPTDSLRRVFVDTIVHDPRVLRFLVEMWGVQGVVPGTDYPYDMGDFSPRAVVEAAFGTGSPEADQILVHNGGLALGLPLPTRAES